MLSFAAFETDVPLFPINNTVLYCAGCEKMLSKKFDRELNFHSRLPWNGFFFGGPRTL